MTNTKPFVLTLLALAACGEAEGNKIELPPPPSSEPQATTPPSIETITLAASEVAVPVYGTGNTEPVRKADLAPAMSGRIEKIHVREGQSVREGQILVTIDARASQLSAEQAHAAAAASEAQADQLDADYKRLEPLAERGSITASRLEQLESQRKAARAQARAAKSAANAATRVTTNAIVRAPFAGTIADLPREVGELAQGTSVARLVDLSQLEVHVRVAARDLGRIAVGDRVVASFPQLGVRADGTIARIGLEVDPQTSTAEVVASIPNAKGELRGGLFAQIDVAPATKRTALVVPKSAVAGTGANAAVFTIEGGKTSRLPVEVAPFDETHVEIVGGVSPGAVIVARATEVKS